MRLVRPLLVLLLAGCAASQQAPVIERAPQAKPDVRPAPTKKASPAAEKDWRPDTYVVKKGDTLYSIGLEFGFDYKDLARWNNLRSPDLIYVGQTLKLKDPKASSPDTPSTAPAATVTAPLKTEPTPTAKAIDGPPLKTEPKATKEPYTDQALAAPPAKAEGPQKAEAPKPAEAAKPAEAPRAEAPHTEKPAPATGDDEAVDWDWPAQGKVIAGFNEASGAKGIDIAGTLGQPVFAAAAGKVVYSGTGLRGYGKLVIIKHNKTYLSAYAHNSQILVKEGQEVTKGQKIAEMGNTDTDRVKLHFEIRRLGKPMDPIKLLPEKS